MSKLKLASIIKAKNGFLSFLSMKLYWLSNDKLIA